MKLSTETHGDPSSPTIVFLHGLTGNRRTFDQVIPEFTANYFVVAADLRGHGQSSHANSYRADEYADDVADLINQLGTNNRRSAGDRQHTAPVILVGHSLGGITALTTAVRHPSLVRALFLEDPPIFEGDPEVRNHSPAAKFFEAYGKQIRGWQAAGASVDEVATAIGTQPGIQDQTRADRVGQDALQGIAGGLLRLDPTTLDAAINGQTWDGFDPLAPVTCPLHLLRADPHVGAVFTTDNATTFQAAIPHVAISMATGMGHGIHSDKDGRAIYLAAVHAFLETL